ncbi:sensor domain-containing protein [Solirubrobacter pauli]|uniref:sensor domain-containing protein n=1 Tax=Solirubrobacter pauli TaxID=166793 RepID=UPI000EAD31EC|nr:EAL domain-containing protein [Solirubrobacter pauli]
MPRLVAPFGERQRRERPVDRLVSRGVVVEAGPQHRAHQAQRAAERLSRVVVEGLDEGVIVTDGDLRPINWNPSALRILGLSEARLQAHNFGARGAGLGGQLESPLAAALRDGTARHATYERIAPDGHAQWLTLTVRPTGDRVGEHARLVCTFADVTARVVADRDLREQRDRAQRFLDVASTLVVVLDPDGIVQLINRQGCELLGFQERELLGRDWFDAVVPTTERLDSRRAFHRVVSRVDTPGETLETFVQTREGESRKISWRNAVLLDDGGRVTAVLRAGEDITARDRAEAQIAFLAYHDRLTGLPNRALLEEQLKRAAARVRRGTTSLALLYFDLDNFKLVNDSLGHAAGDAVLLGTAERVSELTRSGDVLARQGGDEFLLLLHCGDGEDPRAAAQVTGERIAEALEVPFELSDAVFHVGASIGVALMPEHADDPETLLKYADSAMYQAKRSGRGTVAFYEPDGQDDARTRLLVTSRLRRAIAEDELLLHYQPIVRVETGELIAVEALVRWQDPEQGLVPPGLFIPVAEDTGLIDALGQWVVEAVCAQAARWRDEGFTPQIGFNLSPRQLRRPDLVELIAAAIDAHALPREQFTAELTESAVLSDEHRHTSLLEELREAGLKVAIDDFGAGHSSLGRLRALAVDTLKVDRSFLAGVPEDPTAGAIVAAVLSLADALGMNAVVEGVETDAQLAFLREHSCALAQGFLLGRPVPPDEVPRP